MADVVTYIEGLQRKTETAAKSYRALGIENERFAAGRQFGAVALIGAGQPVCVDDDWSEGLPRVWSNRAGGLLQSWCALLSGDLPTASARPASDDALDAYRSDVANKVLQYLRQRLNTAELVSQVVRFAGLHGKAGIRVSFDTEADELRFDPCTIKDYVRDPVADIRRAKWVLFTTWLDEDDAKKRLKAARLTAAPPLEKRTNSLGEELEGVKLMELYAKPCEDFPEGVYAAVIGTDVVDQIANPFYFEVRGRREYILPLFEMKVRNQDDSPYGATPFTDVIPLQRSLNETIASHLLHQRMGRPSLVIPQSLAAGYSPLTTSTIVVPTGQENLAALVQWTAPPPQNADLDKSLNLFTNEMLAVIGLNDTTSGTANRAQSGLAIENLFALDKQKNADATTSMKAMLLDCFRFALLCVAALYSDEKKEEIASATKAAIDLFDESDVGGVDIHMQIASEVDDTGLGKTRTMPAGIARNEARALVADFLAGVDVDEERLTGLDIQAVRAAIDEAKASALADNDRDTWSDLHRLQQEAVNLAGDAPAQAPNPDAATDVKDGES